MTTNRLHVTKVEDREGYGICGECGREGLRWIVTLSDGTTCGTECTKKILGYTMTRKSYVWIADFEQVDETTNSMCGTVVLYRARQGRTWCIARNGLLQESGPEEDMRRSLDGDRQYS